MRQGHLDSADAGAVPGAAASKDSRESSRKRIVSERAFGIIIGLGSIK